MKDLLITDVNAAAVATLRVDMLNNTPANITIFEIKNGSGQSVDNLLIAGTVFRKLQYGWQYFLSFCATNNLKIFAADSNGSNGAVLLANQVPAGTQRPVVSASGSNVLIATDLHLSFLSGDSISIYNADNTLFGTFTLSGNSTYSSPNTTLPTTVAVGTIGTNSGKFIIHN